MNLSIVGLLLHTVDFLHTPKAIGTWLSNSSAGEAEQHGSFLVDPTRRRPDGAELKFMENPTWMSRVPEVIGLMVRIHGLFHLLINGVYWGYNPLILTINPNFLGHPSRLIIGQSTGLNGLHAKVIFDFSCSKFPPKPFTHAENSSVSKKSDPQDPRFTDPEKT